ncbi:MAG TPA: hypothetical protein VLK65_06670 [Vicinamibacteria bacterium]|nr:hypothetical protein [Vicinamibacteria bacterium]
MILRGLGYLSWAAHFSFLAALIRAAVATSSAERQGLQVFFLASFVFIAIGILVMIVHLNVTSSLRPQDLQTWRKRLWLMGTIAGAWYLSKRDRRVGGDFQVGQALEAKARKPA